MHLKNVARGPLTLGAILWLSLPAFAQQVSCLTFRGDPLAADQQIGGTLTNGCGKPVTAFTLSVIAIDTAGKAIKGSGMGMDFIPTQAIAASGLGQLPPDSGQIEPGEQRHVGGFGLAHAPGTAPLASYTASVNSIIFGDGSAVGDDTPIQNLFTHRAQDLAEYEFWQTSLTDLAPRLKSTDSLTRIVDLANVPARVQKMRMPGRESNEVETRANEIKIELSAFDSSVAAGKLTKRQAIQLVEKITAAHIAGLLPVSVRRIP